MPPMMGCDEDEDRTDLATSNSLTSLTPVDEVDGRTFPPGSSGKTLKISFTFQYSWK